MQKILDIRGQVNRVLEEARVDKKLGSSLAAKIIINFPDPSDSADLSAETLKEILIVSDVEIVEGEVEGVIGSQPTFVFDTVRDRYYSGSVTDFGNFGLEWQLAPGEKCQRCWQILPDVGAHAHPGTCARCNAALG